MSRANLGHPRPRQLVSSTVRMTVDLDIEQHRSLKIYAAQQGVTISEVVRAAIDLTLDDPRTHRAMRSLLS